MLTDKELIEWSMGFVLTPVYMYEGFIDYYEHGDEKYVLGEPIDWHDDLKINPNSPLAKAFQKPVEWNPLKNRNHTQMVIEKVYEEINTAVAFVDIFVTQLRSVYRKDDPHIMYSCFDLVFQLTPREVLDAAYRAVKKCES